MQLAIGSAGGHDVAIDAQELVTGRTCLIAQSGAGKSWAIAVLCERLCAAGIGFCIVDTEGEYFSLKDRYPIQWVGTDDRCDQDIQKLDVREFFTRAVVNGTPVIFDVSETEMREKVTALAEALYEIESLLKIPYLWILEEADKFIPQSKDSLKKIEEISRRGRKRGLGLLVATQRPALVNKNVLSQCNNQMLGKLSIENDLKAVDLFFSSREEVESLATLEPGEFFVMGRFLRERTRMRFGRRETAHRGVTPPLQPHSPETRDAAVVAVAPAIPMAQGPPQAARGHMAAGAASLPPAVQRRGVLPAVTEDRALILASPLRRAPGLLSRTDERMASCTLVHWPVLTVAARYLGGILRRTPRILTFQLEGVGAHLLDLRKGFRVRTGFSEVIGLSTEAIRLVQALPTDGATAADMGALLQRDLSVVREALRELQERKAATDAGKAGRAIVYVPLLQVHLPRLAALQAVPPLPLGPVSGSFREPVITREQVRNALKAVEPTAEVTGITPFTYPLWEAVFASGGTRRSVFLDAVTGEVVKGFSVAGGGEE
jgi:Helicase HerA, central domain